MKKSNKKNKTNINTSTSNITNLLLGAVSNSNLIKSYLSNEIKVELLKIANDLSKNEELSRNDFKVIYNKEKIINRYWELVELFQEVEEEITKQSIEKILHK